MTARRHGDQEKEKKRKYKKYRDMWFWNASEPSFGSTFTGILVTVPVYTTTTRDR